jgi:predicted sugar kinase
MRPLRLAFLSLAVTAVFAGCAGRSVQQVSAIPDVQKIGNLEGSYSMKFTSAGETRYATASVKKVAERQYQIARVTVYGPTVYSFTVAEDGTVSSDELGTGTVSYRSDLKLTTIRFEKTNFLCELSR